MKFKVVPLKNVENASAEIILFSIHAWKARRETAQRTSTA